MFCLGFGIPSVSVTVASLAMDVDVMRVLKIGGQGFPLS